METIQQEIERLEDELASLYIASDYAKRINDLDNFLKWQNEIAKTARRIAQLKEKKQST